MTTTNYVSNLLAMRSVEDHRDDTEYVEAMRDAMARNIANRMSDRYVGIVDSGSVTMEEMVRYYNQMCDYLNSH